MVGYIVAIACAAYFAITVMAIVNGLKCSCDDED